jgi:hypothetical protein
VLISSEAGLLEPLSCLEDQVRRDLHGHLALTEDEIRGLRVDQVTLDEDGTASGDVERRTARVLTLVLSERTNRMHGQSPPRMD